MTLISRVMGQNLFLLAYPVRLGLKLWLKQENDDREELHLVGVNSCCMVL